jgi:hypothetical protein
MAALPRSLHPATNPAGYMAAAGTIYAGAAMIYNARYHHGVIDVPVIIAAVGAVAALLTRQVVTPVGDPRDGNGSPLVSAPADPPRPADTGALLSPAPSPGVRIIGEPVTGAPPGEVR